MTLLRRSRMGERRFSARVVCVRLLCVRIGEGGARGPRMGLGLGLRLRKRWEGGTRRGRPRGGGGKCRVGERGVGGCEEVRSRAEGGDAGRAVRGALEGVERVGQGFSLEAGVKRVWWCWEVVWWCEGLRVGVEGSVVEPEESESEL